MVKGQYRLISKIPDNLEIRTKFRMETPARLILGKSVKKNEPVLRLAIIGAPILAIASALQNICNQSADPEKSEAWFFVLPPACNYAALLNMPVVNTSLTLTLLAWNEVTMPSM